MIVIRHRPELCQALREIVDHFRARDTGFADGIELAEWFTDEIGEQRGR